MSNSKTQNFVSFPSVATSGWDKHEGLLNFPGYPKYVTWEGKTKIILAHPHGIEYHALEGGPISTAPGVVEPGTLLHWKLEAETDRGGNSFDTYNLHPFIMGMPMNTAAEDTDPDPDEWTIKFSPSGTDEHDSSTASRFTVGQHLWQADYTDWSVSYVDLGTVKSIDEDENTINVENEPTITAADSVVFVAEEDTNGTFPTLAGVNFFWAGPTVINSTNKKGNAILLYHAYVIRDKITHYGDILTPRNGAKENTFISEKLRKDLPMLRVMW